MGQIESVKWLKAKTLHLFKSLLLMEFENVSKQFRKQEFFAMKNKILHQQRRCSDEEIF